MTTDVDGTPPPTYCISFGVAVPAQAEFCPVCGELIDIVGRNMLLPPRTRVSNGKL